MRVPDWVRSLGYVNTSVLAVGLALGSCGLALKPHRRWLVDLSALMPVLAVCPAVLRLRTYVRSDLPMLRQLEGLCDRTRVPFSILHSAYRRIWPLISVALVLTMSLLIADMFLKGSHMLLRLTSLASEIVLVAGAEVYLTHDRRVKKTLRKIEDVLDSVELAAAPPKAAKFILLLVPKRNREHVVGDLEEEFYTVVVPEYGLRRAQMWYRWHVIIAIAPFLWAKIKRALGLVLHSLARA
ncbi:MAG: hypothetical protein ABSC33_19500 [Candidatus Sulfotelmatobacter sp.]|jgi:hypothetical protein